MNEEYVITYAEKLKELIIRDQYNLEQPFSDLDTDLTRHLIAPPKDKIMRSVLSFLHKSEEYREFLKVMNGAEYNGLLFYGIGHSKHESASELDMITINQALWEDEEFIDENLKDKVVFGENSTSIFTFDQKTQKYEIRDRIGTDRLDQSFPKFHLLLKQEIQKADLRPQSSTDSQLI